MRRISAFPGALLLAASMLTAQGAASRFDDPAPPKAQALGPTAAPKPVAYRGLTFHRAPVPRRGDKPSVAEDWPGFLGPRRDSRSLETGLLRNWPDGGPALVWEMERGEGFAAPAIQRDRLVFTHRVGDTAHIDCLDPATGKRYWRHSYPSHYSGIYIRDKGPRATPTIDGERVYVHGVEGVLHCLELSTGRIIWKRNPTEEFAVGDDFFGVVSSPIIVGDLLIQNVGGSKGPSVAAFDKRNGRLVWGAGREWGPSCASPILGRVHGRERLFVLAGGKSRPPTGGLMVLDPTSGAIDFTHPFRSKTYASVTGSSPLLGEDWVFISSSYGVGSARLDLGDDATYTERWKKRRIGLQFSNAVLDAGHIYMIVGRSQRSGAIVCLDATSGDERSRTDLRWDETIELDGQKRTRQFTVGEGSLLHVDGDLLCLGDSGHLLWLEASPKGAKVLARSWLFRAGSSWTPPVVHRGLLYVCQNEPERFGDKPARLLCYDLRRKAD